MSLKPYWRDFTDGFLSAADRISVMSYQTRNTDPRVWEDYRKTTSPGVRAIQSYTLRDSCLTGDEGFVPDGRSVGSVRKDIRAAYGFGSDGFLTGQGVGIFAVIASLGMLPVGFRIYAAIERRKEDRIKKHFNSLLREIGPA